MKIKKSVRNITLPMSEEQHKKTLVVGKLIFKSVPGIESMDVRQFEEEPPFLEIIFTKNPALKFITHTALTETWDVIKRSMIKLSESDGICVVCFESPKSDYVPTCPTCNEVVCVPCVNASKTLKCAVCRTCMFMEFHKLKKTECRCV